MAKKIPKKVIKEILERSEKLCELCGSNKGCQMHHIVFRSQRVIHTADNMIMLCWDHHHGDFGVHGKYGAELDNILKIKLQRKYFDKGLSEEEVRYKMGGRLYE